MVAHEFGWQLEAWAVFSNHYHFVGHSPEENDDAEFSFTSTFRVEEFRRNTFEITMRGSRLDVVLNGEPVIVNATLGGSQLTTTREGSSPISPEG